MQFSLNKSYQILERTPTILKSLLSDLDEKWIMNNEGPETFNKWRKNRLDCTYKKNTGVRALKTI